MILNFWKFVAKIKQILNTIYFHMTASENDDATEIAHGQMQFER